VWLRHALETFQKRLRGLKEHVAKTGQVVTEAQLRAMEKAKEEKMAWGEIEKPSMWAIWAPRTPSMWGP